MSGFSCRENLNLIGDKRNIFPNKLYISDKEFIFDGLRGIVSDVFIDTVWNMIYERYKVYENL